LRANRSNWLRFVSRASFGDRPITLGVSLIGGGCGQGGRAVDAHFMRSVGSGCVSSHGARAAMVGSTPAFVAARLVLMRISMLALGN
jgi:hypothetical protein